MSLDMGTNAAPARIARPGASCAVTRGRRGVPAMVTLRASVLADLQLELRAAGQDMRSAGHALLYADRVGRRDLTLHTAAQLVSRGERLARS